MGLNLMDGADSREGKGEGQIPDREKGWDKARGGKIAGKNQVIKRKISYSPIGNKFVIIGNQLLVK